MVKAAKKAVNAQCFPALKVMRILRYDVQELGFFSCDVVSGREVEMSESVEWDDVDWDNCSKGADSLGDSGLDTIGQLIGEELGEASGALTPTHDSGVQAATTLTINVAAHA